MKQHSAISSRLVCHLKHANDVSTSDRQIWIRVVRVCKLKKLWWTTDEKEKEKQFCGREKEKE